jgi:predicted aspartyl protease
MWEFYRKTGSLLVLSSTLALGVVSCSSSEPASSPSPSAQNSSPSPSASIPPKAAPASPKAAPASPKAAPASPQANATDTTATGEDNYTRAIDIAFGAVAIGKSAEGSDDWKLAASKWEQVVSLLKTVPASNRNYGNAQKKLAEYQRYLALSKERSIPPKPQASVAPEPDKAFFKVAIKRRARGIPIIDVTFNGKQTSEMLLDTGASSTLINEQLAIALKLKIIGTKRASIADGSVVELPIARLNSMEAGGRILKNVNVAIAPGNAAGLLGHDFFDGYDITIKEDVVEFRRR